MTDSDVQGALREMAGQIGSLTSTVRSLETNWRNQDEKASNGRAVLHAKIDGLRDDFHEYRSKLENVIAEVAELKPTVEKAKAAIDGVAEMKPTFNDIRVAKERAIGALWVSRIFYAAGIGMTAGVTYVFANWVKISIR
ncbi:MAG: hypothetical protein J0H42_04120 [Rhizobiales bacterium]|nr:hypothetical protein [Hyphomicrobiales bacterium]